MISSVISSAVKIPVIAKLVRDGRLSLILGTAGSAQVASAVFHFQLTPCPLLHLTGIPCPGCGASRACAAILQGRFSDALHLHAFAPLLLISIGLFLTAGFLPQVARHQLADRLAWFERTTGLTTLLLLLLLFYWMGRLLYDPTNFARLMRS